MYVHTSVPRPILPPPLTKKIFPIAKIAIGDLRDHKSELSSPTFLPNPFPLYSTLKISFLSLSLSLFLKSFDFIQQKRKEKKISNLGEKRIEAMALNLEKQLLFVRIFFFFNLWGGQRRLKKG